MKYNLRFTAVIFVLALCLLLAACGARSDEPIVQAYQPEATAAPTPKPTPFKEPVMGQGNPVVIDGTVIPTYISEGIVYADFVEFVNAVGEFSETQYCGFNVGGTDFVIEPDSADIYCGGSKFTLSHPTIKYNKGESLYLPLESICSKLGMASLEDKENKCVYYSSTAGMTSLPGGYEIPVISFAGAGLGSGAVKSNEIFVREESFADMLKLLSSGDYTCITFGQLSDIDSIKNPVLLLFDGGYANNYTVVFPLLKQYDIPVTLCMATDNIGADGYLNQSQLEEMSASGLVSLQSAGVSGESLAYLPENELREELEQSRLNLVRISGDIPFVITYPEMAATENTMAVAAEYFNYGVHLVAGVPFSTSGEYMNIPRFSADRDCTDYQLQVWLESIYR